jgi:hypothetical protein
MVDRPAEPPFFYNVEGRSAALSWARYKLKECWTLTLCLAKLRGRRGPCIAHNWWMGRQIRFSREFLARRAAQMDPQLAAAGLVEPHDTPTVPRLLALGPALLLALLPVHWIIAFVAALSRKDGAPLVIYCDGHLSGFALALAARRNGSATATLHHGLYRLDDPGSLMGIRNFVSDRICLWDQRTEQAFLAAGIAPERLARVGEYGFGALSADGPAEAGLVILAPPYDARQLPLFRQLENALPGNGRAVWSLHPALRADHPELAVTSVAAATPRPALAICGDSGALMDALARGIPVVSVSDRPLATAHLALGQAAAIDTAALLRLMDRAKASLARDRAVFGFDPEHAETPEKGDD